MRLTLPLYLFLFAGTNLPRIAVFFIRNASLDVVNYNRAVVKFHCVASYPICHCHNQLYHCLAVATYNSGRHVALIQVDKIFNHPIHILVFDAVQVQAH